MFCTCILVCQCPAEEWHYPPSSKCGFVWSVSWALWEGEISNTPPGQSLVWAQHSQLHREERNHKCPKKWAKPSWNVHLLYQQQIQTEERGYQQFSLLSCLLLPLCAAKAPDLHNTVLVPFLVQRQGPSLLPLARTGLQPLWQANDHVLLPLYETRSRLLLLSAVKKRSSNAMQWEVFSE